MEKDAARPSVPPSKQNPRVRIPVAVEWSGGIIIFNQVVNVDKQDYDPDRPEWDGPSRLGVLMHYGKTHYLEGEDASKFMTQYRLFLGLPS